MATDIFDPNRLKAMAAQSATGFEAADMQEQNRASWAPLTLPTFDVRIGTSGDTDEQPGFAMPRLSKLQEGWLAAHGVAVAPGGEGYGASFMPVGYRPWTSGETDEPMGDPTKGTPAQQAEWILQQQMDPRFADAFWNNEFMERAWLNTNMARAEPERWANVPDPIAYARQMVDLERQMDELGARSSTWTMADNDAMSALLSEQNRLHKLIPLRDRGNLWSGNAGIVRNVGRGLRHVIFENPASAAALGAYFGPLLASYVGGGAASGAAAGAGAGEAVAAGGAFEMGGLAGTGIPEAWGITQGAGMLTPILQGAAGGALQGGASALATGQNPLVGALRGGVAGGAGAGAVGVAGIENPYAAGALRGGVQSGVGAALTGQEWLRALLMGAGGGLQSAAAAPQSLEVAGSQPISEVTAELPPLTSPELLQNVLASVPEAVPGTTLPVQGNPDFDVTQASPEIIGALLSAQGMFNPLIANTGLMSSQLTGMEPAESEDGIAPTPQPTVEAPTEADVRRYASVAKKVVDLYKTIDSAFEVPEFAIPPREEGQSEEEYRQILSDSAIEYLGLDADAMRESGLVPGSQEYMDYILEQADAVIEAAFGEAGPDVLEGEDAEAIKEAFRDKTEEEMQQLARALYVRGALGGQSFSGEAVDPFTGDVEDLGLREGEAAQGSQAAAQRGVAQLLQRIGRMSGRDSRGALRSFLGRNPDLFGMNEAQARKQVLRNLTAEYDEDDEKKSANRGMFSTVAPAQPSWWAQFEDEGY